MEQISVEEAKRMLAEGPRVQLVDCRKAWEVAICRLPGAIHIPLGDIVEQGPAELDRSIPVFVYCHAGIRSVNAAVLLERAGFVAMSMRGGTEAWSLRIDPGVARY